MQPDYGDKYPQGAELGINMALGKKQAGDELPSPAWAGYLASWCVQNQRSLDSLQKPVPSGATAAGTLNRRLR